MQKNIAFITLLLSMLTSITHANNLHKVSMPVEKYVLDNGLTVLLSEDHSSPFVAINVWYFVGAINEEANKSGLAHLFEHLMFEGSRHVKNGQHFRLLEDAGAVDVNGSTSFDKTNYYETLPKNMLERGLFLESSRMSFLNIEQATLDEQLAVVLSESGQRTKTPPYGLAALNIWQKVFEKGHPFHGRVMGSDEDLKNATLRDAQKFYDDHYGPSNASLAIVGDFDKAEVKALVNKYFASLPKTKTIKTPVLPPIELKDQEIINFDEKFGKLPALRIHYITPALYQPGDAELDIVSYILTGGEYGRLTKALTRDKQLAYSVGASQQSFSALSVFTIDVLLNPGVDEKDALKEIDTVLGELLTNPPSEIEIERGRRSILTSQYLGLQDFGGAGGKAELLQTYNRFANNPDFLEQDRMRYTKVDEGSLTATVSRYLPVGKARKILIAKPVQYQVVQQGHTS